MTVTDSWTYHYFLCFIILLLTIKHTIILVNKSIDSATLMFSQSNHSVKLILKMSSDTKCAHKTLVTFIMTLRLLCQTLLDHMTLIEHGFSSVVRNVYIFKTFMTVSNSSATFLMNRGIMMNMHFVICISD